MTYCQLRCGKLPIRGTTVHEVMYKQLSQEPDLSGLPSEERRVVHRALLKEPRRPLAGLPYVRGLPGAEPRG